MSEKQTLKEFRELYNPSGTLNRLIVKVLDSNEKIHTLELLETSHFPEELTKFVHEELIHKNPYEKYNREIEGEIHAVRDLAEEQIEARRSFILED